MREELFIIGMGRSGTTWVNQWLSKNPTVFTGPESHIFVGINAIVNYGQINRKTGPSAWTGGRKELINLCRQFLDGFFSARSKGQNYLVEKTPFQFMFRKLINEIYPEAKFLHIYRDGKCVVESYMQSKWNKLDVKEASKKWIDTMNCILNPENDIDKHLTLTVKYENLILSPETSREITAFMNIQHHFDIKPWKKPVNTKNKKHEPYLWKKITRKKLKKMKIMNPTLIKLGYKPI